MKTSRLDWLLVAGLGSLACGGPEHPPVIDDTPPVVVEGTAGADGEGGAGTAGGEPFGIEVTRCESRGAPPVTGPWSRYKFGPVGDVVGFCDGWLALANQQDNAVQLWNHRTDAGELVELTAAPGRLAHARDEGLLFVQLLGATSYARIDLETLAVDLFEVPRELRDLAVGPDGILFTLDGEELTIYRQIDGTVLGSIAADADLVAAIPGTSRVVVADTGLSPSSLLRYGYDPDGYEFELQEELWDAGTNGQSLELSRDGEHLAFPCGGGNGSGYTIFDYSPLNFTRVAGEWPIGAYPRRAAFSEDGSVIATADDARLVFYDVSSHAELNAIDNVLSGATCGYGDIHQLTYSYDDTSVVALFNCGFDDDAAIVAVAE